MNYEKISQILRADPALLENLEKRLRPGVFDEVLAENQKLIQDRLTELGLSRGPTAAEIFAALTAKAETDDRELQKITGRDPAGFCDYAKKIHPPPRGFFLKKEKARELLLAEPPRHVMAALGYKTAGQLTDNEDLLEVMSALRFLEERQWLNQVFFRQYQSLTPADFEERALEFRPLPLKWGRAAERFVSKKYHNISHLKELGVIFIIPIFLGFTGETLRDFSLIIHYLFEIEYYTALFLRFSRQPAGFAEKLIALLRGDVPDIGEKTRENGRQEILVIQRYLSKDDENDPRLSLPRINPEALHWQKAIGQVGLPFWQNLDWAGDYFFRGETLTSFNLVDVMMKRIYHQREAFWNKIFIEHFGQEKVEELSKENIIGGRFAI